MYTVVGWRYVQWDGEVYIVVGWGDYTVEWGDVHSSGIDVHSGMGR